MDSKTKTMPNPWFDGNITFLDNFCSEFLAVDKIYETLLQERRKKKFEEMISEISQELMDASKGLAKEEVKSSRVSQEQ